MPEEAVATSVIEWFLPHSSSPRGSGKSGIRVSRRGRSLFIRVGPDVMSTMGWKIGQKVLVGWSESQQIVLATCPEGHDGYTISANSPGDRDRAASGSASVIGVVRGPEALLKYFPNTWNGKAVKLDWHRVNGQVLMSIPELRKFPKD